jgi:hypothetical protein
MRPSRRAAPATDGRCSFGRFRAVGPASAGSAIALEGGRQSYRAADAYSGRVRSHESAEPYVAEAIVPVHEELTLAFVAKRKLAAHAWNLGQVLCCAASVGLIPADVDTAG